MQVLNCVSREKVEENAGSGGCGNSSNISNSGGGGGGGKIARYEKTKTESEMRRSKKETHRECMCLAILFLLLFLLLLEVLRVKDAFVFYSIKFLCAVRVDSVCCCNKNLLFGLFCSTVSSFRFLSSISYICVCKHIKPRRLTINEIQYV